MTRPRRDADRRRAPHGRPAPRGMTLVEVLVIVVVAVILFSVIVPQVRPAIEETKLREGARQVNAYLAGAQALAIAQQRGVGVVIPRATNNPAGALEMFTVETPPPYSGDSFNAFATINGGGGTYMANLSGASFLASLVTPNDHIRFSHRGLYFRITGVSGSQVTFVDESGYNPPVPPPLGVPVPFQIVRKPVRSASLTLQLPRGVAIDVANSGIGPTGQFGASTLPVTVLFSPQGSVSQVYLGTTPVAPSGSLYFLVGRFEALGAENLNDGNNRWVSVRARTGQVITVQNNPNSGGNVASARGFALQGQGDGGL